MAACVVAPLSGAFACGPLASIALSAATARPGDRLTGTGDGFSNSHGGGPSAEPVVLHFDSRTGPVLWAGRPGADGTVQFAFTVPEADPGTHTVVATQTNADGEPAPGTPARATFDVLAPPPTTTQPPPAVPTSAVPDTAPPPAPLPLPSASPPPSSPSGSSSASPATAAGGRRAVATTAAPRQPGPAPAPSTTAGAHAPAPTTVAAPPADAAGPPSSPPSSGPARPAEEGGPLKLAARGSTPGTAGSSGWAAVLVGLVLVASLVVSAFGVRRFRSHRLG